MNYSKWEPNPPDDRPNPSVPDPDKPDPIPGYPDPTMPPPEPQRDPAPDPEEGRLHDVKSRLRSRKRDVS